MSESQQRVPESQIATLVGRSLASLQTLIPAVDSSSKHTSAATSYLARLKIWAGSLGAHRHSGNRSLDYRLRDASNIRNHIQSLLQDLCEAVDGGVYLKANLNTTTLTHDQQQQTRKRTLFRQAFSERISILLRMSSASTF